MKIAPGYEADCKKCIYRKNNICKKRGIISPCLIACCHFISINDSKKMRQKRREQRKQFLKDIGVIRTNEVYNNITKEFRKYIKNSTYAELEKKYETKKIHSDRKRRNTKKKQ